MRVMTCPSGLPTVPPPVVCLLSHSELSHHLDGPAPPEKTTSVSLNIVMIYSDYYNWKLSVIRLFEII